MEGADAMKHIPITGEECGDPINPTIKLTRTAAIGYIIIALQSLEYPPERVKKIAHEMRVQMDYRTVGDAEEAFKSIGQV